MNVMPADDSSPISAALARCLITAWNEGKRGSIMKDVPANSAKNHQRMPRKSSDEQIALHLCYGQIGISAVAAAARYQSGAKNSVHNPVHAPDEHRAANA